MTVDIDLDAAMASAVPLAADSRRVARPEFYLDVVVRSGLDVSVADAITAGDLERTMEGASTLSLTLFDPHRHLLRNPDLARAIDMNFHGYWWRLVKVSKSGDDLTLTFEDRDVAYLRRHTKPRKSYRGTVTRAQFIRQLVREVGQRHPKGKRSTNPAVAQRPIAFICPELRKVQPVGAIPRSESQRDDNREAGLNRRAHLTVKGARATATQRRNGERVLDVADRLGAGPKATLALMESVIIESQVQNLTHGDGDSIGILQVRVGIHGRRVASSIERSVEKFLKTGFTSGKGAMELARETNMSAADIAAAVQGPANPVYHTVRSEAQEWIDAYGGASGTDTGGTNRTGSARSRKRYEFRRGEPGKPEDSWTAIQRLAEEVQWHAFMDRGRLYYVSDDWLMRQKPRFILEENDDGVQAIDFDLDQGKLSSELTVSARAEVFKVPVGSVVQIRKCGVANGRYLVTRVHQNIFDTACDITLRRPTPKLAEPLSELKEQSAASSGGGSTTASSADVASGSPKHIIDSVVCPLARKHDMATGITPAMVSAANARHGATVNGNRSDHQGPPGLAWAADMSNGSSPTPQMDALARDLANTFGIRWTGSGLVNGGKSGYRYQLIYRTTEGGNHYNHVHFGVRKT